MSTAPGNLKQLTPSALLDRNLAERPGQVAFIEGERSISHTEFAALCGSTAGWLAAQGVGPGDRVAVWLVNRVEWLALYFGLARLGAVLVAINTRFRASELEYVLERSEADTLVLQLNFRKINFPAVLQDVSPAKARSLKRVIVVDAGKEMPKQVLGKPTFAFDPGETSCPAACEQPDALSVLFTTSGTTKGPKLVMHTQRTVTRHSESIARSFELDRPGARMLATFPFCGVAGFNAALAAFAAGAPVVMLDTFDGAAAARLARRHEVTHLLLGDDMLRRVLENVSGDVPFPSLRVMAFGAYHPGVEELMQTAQQRNMQPMVGLYGSSEVQGLFALQPVSAPFAHRIEGGGRPVSGADAQVRVRDVETGEFLPPGRSGELEIRAPTNFVGYLNDPETSAQAIDAEGFFRTGDIGRLRDDGTFVYETRRGDAMRLAGFLVSPLEIEDVLKSAPGVADVQVVAVDIAAQSRCVAFVIPVPGTAASADDVIAAVSSRMAAFKVPARIWFVDQFPTTESANGVKVQRARLRDMAIGRLAEE